MLSKFVIHFIYNRKPLRIVNKYNNYAIVISSVSIFDVKRNKR